MESFLYRPASLETTCDIMFYERHINWISYSYQTALAAYDWQAFFPFPYYYLALTVSFTSQSLTTMYLLYIIFPDFMPHLPAYIFWTNCFAFLQVNPSMNSSSLIWFVYILNLFPLLYIPIFLTFDYLWSYFPIYNGSLSAKIKLWILTCKCS